MQVAYPGVWLRDDVYAIHGHYSDLHATVPTFERLAAGAMARWVVTLPDDGATPDDYEAALAPLYAWMHALTQRSDHAVVSAGRRRVGARVGRAGRPRPPRGGRCARRCWAPASRVAVAGDQRARHRPGRRATSRAPGCAAATCAASARCCAGSTCARRTWSGGTRTAPARGRATTSTEWTTRAGGRIHNTGSWVYQPHFLSDAPNGSPYWPGTAVLIEESGPPELVRLLGDRGHRELATPGVKQVAWHVTPGADLAARARAAVWCGCSTSGKQPGSDTAIVRPSRVHLARALEHRPHAAGLVRPAVGAGLVLGLRGQQQRPARPRAAAAAAARARSPSSSWISRSVSS